MKINSVLSDVAVSSTGAPQGCVRSPFLFTLYANDCVSQQSNQFILKFSDDTILLHLSTRHCRINDYKATVGGFVAWCDDHLLQINVKKTEEVIIDPRLVGDRSSVVVHGQDIKQVDSYKYYHIDSELKWHSHVSSICTRIHQHLHFFTKITVIQREQQCYANVL